jgi:hypothetical protein
MSIEGGAKGTHSRRTKVNGLDIFPRDSVPELQQAIVKPACEHQRCKFLSTNKSSQERELRKKGGGGGGGKQYDRNNGWSHIPAVQKNTLETGSF